MGRYPQSFLALGPPRIFIWPCCEVAARPVNSLTHKCSMDGGHQLVYQVYLCRGIFDHSDHWVDNAELDLSYKPQSFQRPRGLKAEAGTEVGQAALGVRVGGAWQGVAGPHPPPQSFGILTCNSAVLNDSQNLDRRMFLFLFESLRCSRHSYIRIRHSSYPLESVSHRHIEAGATQQ